MYSTVKNYFLEISKKQTGDNWERELVSVQDCVT